MSTSQKCKATFVLPSRILEEIREAVHSGLAHSASALVREALEERLKILREEGLRREFEEAARDPDFMSDIKQTMADFERTDAETLRLASK
ncbi:MAG: hypothetical protein HYU64_21895 [Armatimonadetes bacterium]|nr:hypothetical protein [Armatimonadota bacterium]